MTDEKIIEYVMDSPENTNPSVLKSMLKSNKTQSDWNQNDSTAADYVKNRPFYTGDPVETVLLEETTAEFHENQGFYVYNLRNPLSLKVGQTYQVSWDGTVYECVCTEHGRVVVLGNLSIINEGEDTGEPFVYSHRQKQEDKTQAERRVSVKYGRFMTADTSASHTISISANVAPITKIDEKYLPDSIISDISTARSIANAAQTTANTAKSTADTAQSTADTAQSTANTAKSTADTAKSTADTAQSTANTAKTTAENAQTTANTAKTTAENAQTTAENARSTANTAKTEVAKALTVDSSGSIYAPIGAMNDGAYQSLNLSSKDQYHSASFKVTESVGLQICVGRDCGSQSSASNPSTVEFIANGAPRMCLKGIDELIMNSSTAGSTKKFKITVDDSGTLIATEVTS